MGTSSSWWSISGLFGNSGSGANASSGSATAAVPAPKADVKVAAPSGESGAPAAADQSELSAALTNLAIEIAGMAVSYALLFVGIKYFMKEMDPMKEQKKNSANAKRRLEDKIRASGREPFEMNDYEMIVSNDLVYPEDLDVSFSMIGGHDRVKQEIFDIVALPLRRPDLFQGSALLSPPKGILLYGPPGTGKTMMAKAIAKESGAAFINLQMSTTMNKWFGESQKLVRATFTLAWKLAPCVIFIDEIDSFLRERSSDDHAAQGNMKAEFMALWDGMMTQDMAASRTFSYGVIIVGATNRPGDVDSAILRRMPRTFKMALPDVKQRFDILRIFLHQENLHEDLIKGLPALAKRLEGYSGSDLKELCQAAAMRPFREFAASCRETQSYQPGKQLRKLTVADFDAAMQDVGATGQAAYDYQDETASQQRNASSFLQQQEQQQQLFMALAAMMQAMMQQQQQQRQPGGGGASGDGPGKPFPFG